MERCPCWGELAVNGVPILEVAHEPPQLHRCRPLTCEGMPILHTNTLKNAIGLSVCERFETD
jgi:hypothetical protein